MATMSAFENPCLDHIEKRLNIHEYLVEQEDATFFVTLCSLSMRDLGMLPKDIVVVNRAKNPAIGNIVLAAIDGVFTIKQLARDNSGHVVLQSGNSDFKPVQINDGMDFQIWGVVTGVFRKIIP